MTPSRAPLPSYRNLIVWQKSIRLVVSVYRLTATLPRDERYGLISQLRRAAVSIPANIAEGYGRATRGEYLNQLSVAKGSVNEVDTLCVVCAELGLCTPDHLQSVQDQVTALQKMLTRLRQRLQPRK